MPLNNQIIVPKYISGLDKFQETILTPQEIGAYSGNNPSGFITGVDLSNYVTKTNGEFINRPTVNGTGVLLSGEAAYFPETIVYTTGDQTISGIKNFVTRPQVNNIGVVISGEAYPSNNPSGFITGVDLSAYPIIQQLNDLAPDEGGIIVSYAGGLWDPVSENIGFNVQDEDLIILRNGSPIAGIRSQALTSFRAYTLPNSGGVIALTSDINSTGLILNTKIDNVSGNLQNKINSLSGAAVLLYGDQTIDGTKTFRNSVYIHDLYVTGTEFIANVENNFIESPYILLNLTGGAVDGGIFFVTGSGLTGVNDYGPIIGFDHTDKFKFGIARRSDDLSTLDSIAGISDITDYSGFANNNFYSKNNPSGFITGVDLSSYATITNLASTGSTLDSKINSLSGNLTANYATITNLASTGSTLQTNINNLSGYINSSNSNIVFTTGSQTISGQKTFELRPQVNGTGVLLSGEAAQLPDTIVYTSGNQIVSGSKTFISGLTILVQPTGTNPALRITGIWSNTGQVYTGIFFNIIDSGSNSNSLLIDLKSNNINRFNVSKIGSMTINAEHAGGAITNIYGHQFSPNAGSLIQSYGIMHASNYRLDGGHGLYLNDGAAIGWAAGNLQPPVPNLELRRDNSGILAQRNGINPQQFRVYNITGTNTGEFGLLGWQNNNFIVGAQQTQGGVLRDLTLTGANININASGQFNIFDPTNIVGNLIVSGNTTITGHLSAATKSFLITHPIDSNKKLQYGSLESPYHGIRITDRAKIADDSVIVKLPNYISSLVNDEKTNIQLTNINHSKVLFVKEVNVAQNYFVVGTDRGWFDKKTYEFYWSFTAERKDVPRLEVEF